MRIPFTRLRLHLRLDSACAAWLRAYAAPAFLYRLVAARFAATQFCLHRLPLPLHTRCAFSCYLPHHTTGCLVRLFWLFHTTHIRLHTRVFCATHAARVRSRFGSPTFCGCGLLPLHTHAYTAVRTRTVFRTRLLFCGSRAPHTAHTGCTVRANTRCGCYRWFCGLRFTAPPRTRSFVAVLRTVYRTAYGSFGSPRVHHTFVGSPPHLPDFPTFVWLLVGSYAHRFTTFTVTARLRFVAAVIPVRYSSYLPGYVHCVRLVTLVYLRFAVVAVHTVTGYVLGYRLRLVTAVGLLPHRLHALHAYTRLRCVTRSACLHTTRTAPRSHTAVAALPHGFYGYGYVQLLGSRLRWFCVRLPAVLVGSTFTVTVGLVGCYRTFYRVRIHVTFVTHLRYTRGHTHVLPAVVACVGYGWITLRSLRVRTVYRTRYGYRTHVAVGFWFLRFGSCGSRLHMVYILPHTPRTPAVRLQFYVAHTRATHRTGCGLPWLVLVYRYTYGCTTGLRCVHARTPFVVVGLRYCHTRLLVTVRWVTRCGLVGSRAVYLPHTAFTLRMPHHAVAAYIRRLPRTFVTVFGSLRVTRLPFVLYAFCVLPLPRIFVCHTRILVPVTYTRTAYHTVTAVHTFRLWLVGSHTLRYARFAAAAVYTHYRCGSAYAHRDTRCRSAVRNIVVYAVTAVTLRYHTLHACARVYFSLRLRFLPVYCLRLRCIRADFAFTHHYACVLRFVGLRLVTRLRAVLRYARLLRLPHLFDTPTPQFYLTTVTVTGSLYRTLDFTGSHFTAHLRCTLPTPYLILRLRFCGSFRMRMPHTGSLPQFLPTDCTAACRWFCLVGFPVLQFYTAVVYHFTVYGYRIPPTCPVHCLLRLRGSGSYTVTLRLRGCRLP